MSTSSAPSGRRISTRTFTLWALGIALVIATVVSIWASSNPDGLEFVAEAVGFSSAAQDSATAGSPLADYTVAGLDGNWLSILIVGVVGCGITFALAWLLGRLARRG
ncbi:MULTISPECIES: PDGLE domain-containing protein [Microbacterium]|jgi:cobalt/nickel transport protein|uniref:PDGLE domain-containing protein n=1 Tax=Microbacterium schleiferi TaxID=69362 RepID=A0ABU7V799_9MICO|nr:MULTISPECIES: PDGLE domain-containing protein [unclassified Microbacterium]OJV97252.1 MAG: hypothetical protein BGO47_10330 [Microbacterium sp. 67-17]